MPGGTAVNFTVALKQAFLDGADHGGHGYCIQLLVSTKEADCSAPDLPNLERVRSRVAEMATSTVVVGDADLIKVHAHAADPRPLVDYAKSLGDLIDQSVQDMDRQESEFSAGHRSNSRPVGDISLVAVASGRGLAALFIDLGACEVVAGGRTKNPSVKDISEAIERAPTQAVIVLPNDGNVIPAAEQAAAVSTKTVGIAPTTSVQQGVAAALALNAMADIGPNLTAMRSAAAAIRCAEVTIGARDVRLDGVNVVAGEFIGVLDGRLIVSDPSAPAVVDALMDAAAVGEDDLVTLYRGEPLPPGDAEAEMERLTARHPKTEFEMVDGGQPHYHYLISIE